MTQQCVSCRYFEPIRGHPQSAGTCCVNPPTPVPMMQAGPGAALMRAPQPAQPVTAGIDPPVAATRRACRHYSREFDA